MKEKINLLQWQTVHVHSLGEQQNTDIVVVIGTIDNNIINQLIIENVHIHDCHKTFELTTFDTFCTNAIIQ